MYNPLQDSDDIRLLYLQPRSSAVSCKVQHVKFSDNPQYEALSYMWGSTCDEYTITLDDNAHPVRANLWSALSHLQLDDEVRALWIDAVCINQQDVKERNHQVNQMGRIYSEAQRVVVWVGESDDSSASAFRAVSSTLLPHQRHVGKRAYSIGQDFETMRPFWTRDYWNRLWIIQELVLARDILLQCGDSHVEWSKMASFFEHIEEYARRGPCSTTKAMATEIRKTMPARYYRQWRDRRQGQLEDSNLHDLCLRYSEAKCEDPRDKIYGLLSFAAKCCKEAVPVDYTLSRYEVCGLVLRHHATVHTYDEGVASLLEPPGIPELSGRTTTLIIRESQIFHRSLGITRADCPALTDPDIDRLTEMRSTKTQGNQKIGRRATFRRLFDLTEVRRDRLEKIDRRFSMRALSLRRSTLLGGSLTNAAIPTASQTKIKVMGNIRGRITHLSPRLSSPPGTIWTEIPYVFMAGDALIYEELERIKQLFDEAELAHLRHTSSGSPIITSERDLVSEITHRHSRAVFPPEMVLPNPKQPSPTWEPADFLSLLNRLWFDTRNSARTDWQAQLAASGQKYEECRIAIEENGMITFAPASTEVGDLVLCFPQSDAVAIVRRYESVGRVIGRAMGLLENPPTTLLSMINDWPTMNQDRDYLVRLELDTSTLQILTRASSGADVLGSKLLEGALDKIESKGSSSSIVASITLPAGG